MNAPIDYNNFESVKYFDNVFTDEDSEKIRGYLNQPRWEFGHCSVDDSPIRFWATDLIQEDFFTQQLFSTIKSLIGNNFEIIRCYANGQTVLQDGSFHTDHSGPDQYTFLYYPMKEWYPQWEGETVFRLPSGNLEYVLPFPNGAVFFPGWWYHYGRSPSISFLGGIRHSVAYKLQKT